MSMRYVNTIFLYLWVGGFFFFSSRRRHTRFKCDWSSDVCSSDLLECARIHKIVGRAREAGLQERIGRGAGDLRDGFRGLVGSKNRQTVELETVQIHTGGFEHLVEGRRARAARVKYPRISGRKPGMVGRAAVDPHLRSRVEDA